MQKDLFVSIEMKVSAKSNAEKLGVRLDDIFLSVNGEAISSAVRYMCTGQIMFPINTTINRSHISCIIFCFMLIYVPCCYF